MVGVGFVGFLIPLAFVELGKILGGMEVGTVYDSVASGAEFAFDSLRLLFGALDSLHISLARSPALLVVVHHRMGEITSTFGKKGTRRTIAADCLCGYCGITFITRGVLLTHMAKIALRAPSALASFPVLTYFFAPFVIMAYIVYIIVTDLVMLLYVALGDKLTTIVTDSSLGAKVSVLHVLL